MRGGDDRHQKDKRQCVREEKEDKGGTAMRMIRRKFSCGIR